MWRGKIGRVLSRAAATLVVLAVTVPAAGCGSGDLTKASPSAAAIKTGGILKVGVQPGDGQYDPALMAGSVGDTILNVQVQENLVDLAPNFGVMPVLATEWSSGDGRIWRLTLRDGVTFSNGEPFTADDVVYSFDRLRSRELGSPVAEKYSGIESVIAEDATHVIFNLSAPNSEFIASLTDYRAKMLCKSVEDPMKELVGTGPFMLDTYAAEDVAVLKKNLDYWGKDDQGNQLPYLDGVEFVYSPDAAGQIERLQGGSLNWVGNLTSEQKRTVEANQNLKTITTATNYCYELQIRCDEGPGRELAFRQALMAGTNRQEIVDLVASGVGLPGNGTLVGPAYSAFYLGESVSYDPEKAEQLLAGAGYADGVKIKLAAQTAAPIPALATVWRAQMKKIGVDVDIQKVSPYVYYTDKGQDNWYRAHFSLVEWGTSATPLTYFQLALTSTAPWNYSRWSNEEFDAIATRIPLALDEAERVSLYRRAQQILQDEVPMINFIVDTAVAAESSNVDGVELSPDWAHTLFRTAHFLE